MISASCAVANDQCDQLSKYFQKSRKTSISELINPDTQVTFVGEYHDDNGIKRQLYRENFLKILFKNSQEKNCLFLELRPNYTSTDSLNGTRDAVSSTTTALMADLGWTAMHDLMENSTVDNREKMEKDFFSHYQSAYASMETWVYLADRAKALGAKVFYVDGFGVPERLTVGYAVSPVGMNERNKVMATRIADEFAAGNCRKAVTINGMAHITEESIDSQVKSIPSLVRSAGLKTQSFLLTSGREKKNLFEIFGSSCPIVNSILRSGKNFYLNGKTNVKTLFVGTGTDYFDPDSKIPPLSRENLQPYLMDESTSILLQIGKEKLKF